MIITSSAVPLSSVRGLHHRLRRLTRKTGGLMRALLDQGGAGALTTIAWRGPVGQEGVPVGWATAHAYGKQIILNVYVRESARKRGLGTALLALLLPAAARRWPGFRSGAIPLDQPGRRTYARFGLKKAGS